jgi:hypothetical protein
MFSAGQYIDVFCVARRCPNKRVSARSVEKSGISYHFPITAEASRNSAAAREGSEFNPLVTAAGEQASGC